MEDPKIAQTHTYGYDIQVCRHDTEMVMSDVWKTIESDHIPTSLELVRYIADHFEELTFLDKSQYKITYCTSANNGYSFMLAPYFIIKIMTSENKYRVSVHNINRLD